MALFPALVGDFFGRIAVGAIVGFIFAIAAAPSALGPLMAGYLYDWTGSYRLAFELSAMLNLLALSLIFVLRRTWLDRKRSRFTGARDRNSVNVGK